MKAREIDVYLNLRTISIVVVIPSQVDMVHATADVV